MTTKLWTCCLLSSLLLLSGRLLAAETLETESRTARVTVYPGAARVTREVKVDLKKGEHSIRLKDIVPQFDENSLTVAGRGTAQVKIFGGYLKKDFLQQEADQRVKDLQSQIQALDDQVIVLNSHSQVLSKKQQFLDSVNMFAKDQLPQDLATEFPTSQELGSILDFLGQGFETVEQAKEELRIKLRDLAQEKHRLQRELANLRGQGSRMQRSVVVDLECLAPGSFTLEVAYLVRGANWQPLYDARAEFEANQVELTAYGVVRQSTGEDWGEVELTLSTAQPTLGGRMPRVDPWVLRPFEARRRSARHLNDKMMEAKTLLAGDMQYEAFTDGDMPAAAPAEVDAEMNYADVSSRGISVVYAISRPATVKSDGTEHKFPVATQTLAADYKYSTFPRVTPLSYLGSRVTNSKDLQLLAGPVNLFLDEDYVGKSSVDLVGPGQEFDLFLGVDESVKVKREQVSSTMDDVLLAGIPSPNKKTTVVYKLTVENYKAKPVTVKLFEAMPVSGNDRIKVKILNVSRKPSQKDWKDRQGIWLWELDLKPQQKQEITYSFIIEHPRDMRVQGMSIE